MVAIPAQHTHDNDRAAEAIENELATDRTAEDYIRSAILHLENAAIAIEKGFIDVGLVSIQKSNVAQELALHRLQTTLEHSA